MAEKITNGNTRVIDDLRAVLLEDQNPNPMDIFILIKRAEAFLEHWRKELTGDANAVFAELYRNSGAQKEWSWGPLATLGNYSPAGTWRYPESIARMEASIKRAKAVAQTNGSARKMAAPKSDTIPLFSVSLIDRPSV